MKQLPWTWFDHRTDLPRWLLEGIGQIMAEWSVLDRELEEIIQLLLDVDIALSRIVLHSMQARNRAHTIDYLLEWYVYHGKLDSRFERRFQKLAATLMTQTQVKRDMVAHGLWAKRAGRWRVLRLKAARKTPELRPDVEKVSRPVVPQSEEVTPAKIATIINEIVAGASELKSFRDDLYGALSPSRYRPLPYTRNRRKSAKKTRRAALPRSSRARR